MPPRATYCPRTTGCVGLFQTVAAVVFHMLAPFYRATLSHFNKQQYSQLHSWDSQPSVYTVFKLLIKGITNIRIRHLQQTRYLCSSLASVCYTCKIHRVSRPWYPSYDGVVFRAQNGRIAFLTNVGTDRKLHGVTNQNFSIYDSVAAS